MVGNSIFGGGKKGNDILASKNLFFDAAGT